MFLINKEENRISKINPRSFKELGFKEREHIQEWIANNPSCLGEELLIIQKEFDGFDDTRERLDLLALDKGGDIVVIENKLDDSGRDVTWQILKYASYCATLTKPQIIRIYQQFLDASTLVQNAEEQIADFLELSDIEEAELNNSQRMILIAANFRKEVTSTVLWLLNNYQIKIQCFKLSPHQMEETLLLNIDQIIPVKELEEYIIQMAGKKKEENIGTNELKAIERTRIEFWRVLLDKFNQTESLLFKNINPSKDGWIWGSTGMTGVGLNFSVSQKHARTELYISRSNQEENKKIFDELMAHRDQIEKQFPNGLIWQPLEGKIACRIKDQLDDVNIKNEEDWDSMISFLVDSMVKLERAMQPHITQINLRMKGT